MGDVRTMLTYEDCAFTTVPVALVGECSPPRRVERRANPRVPFR